MPISKTYQSKEAFNSSIESDTIYGIEHEEFIPIRFTEDVSPGEEVLHKTFTLSPINNRVNTWQTLMLIFAVFLVAVLKAFSYNRYRLALKALFRYSVAQEITREEKVLFHRSNIFLSITHTITFSLFLYEFNVLYLGNNIDGNGFGTFVFLFGGVLLLYIFKYIFAKILMFIFDKNSISVEYSFNVSLYNGLFGVLLIPLLCVCYFTPFPFLLLLNYGLIPLTLLVFIARLFRLFIVGKNAGLFYVYIFLYICTLEILPLVVLFRIFIHN